MSQEQNNATHLWPHKSPESPWSLALPGAQAFMQWFAASTVPTSTLPSKSTKPFTNALEIYIDNRDHFSICDFNMYQPICTAHWLSTCRKGHGGFSQLVLRRKIRVMPFSERLIIEGKNSLEKGLNQLNMIFATIHKIHTASGHARSPMQPPWLLQAKKVTAQLQELSFAIGDRQL